jgi:hypothetical protein
MSSYIFQQSRTAGTRPLGALEALLDPATTRHLDVLGVGEGWRCLEDVRLGGGRGQHQDLDVRRLVDDRADGVDAGNGRQVEVLWVPRISSATLTCCFAPVADARDDRQPWRR